MNSDQWQKAKDLFEAARQCSTDERRRSLDENCGGDAAVRREVESLLAASDDAASFLEQTVSQEVAETMAGQKTSAGKTLGHYKILSQIGAGGMGEVYLAKDKKLDRQVAIKILNEKFSRDDSNLGRFTQEAKSASSLNHPHILVIYEIGTDGDAHYIVSEFVEGKTLREHFKQSPMKLSEVLEVSIQIAGALTAAHTARIIHRDIKPENIMVRPDGYIKILDFGLAKLVEQQKSFISLEDATVKQNQTAKGVILGTVNYMSPEQAKGERVDERTDVFSLGIVIYEMIAGRTPFAGDSVSETFANLINAEPQPLLRYASNIPDEMQRIAAKMLRKNKDERYQTMKDVLTDLKEVQRELEFQNKLERAIPPLREEAKTQIINAATTDAPQTTSNAKSLTSKIKKPALTIGLLVLVLAAIGLGYWFFAGRSVRTTPIESVAILPFVNDSGTSDVEYLSDGITETLIGSLSQIPNLNVKARSSVFRYKGKDTNAQTIGKELNVQAILMGRVVQRGQDLILYVELVDAATENSLWKQIYNKTMTNLVSLQNDIARDVADKLKAKLSGADEQKLAKNYTENTEAYQFYLKGRYHVLKLTPAEVQKGISYFQEAIKIDPNYALAYAGLADAYRTLPLGPEKSPTEFQKAKVAANKALEIDDRLAEAHAILGYIIFWYDWDWDAAENQIKRALELDPNSADAHQYYAHLLSNTGRHAEALAQIKRARELDPLNLRINVQEGEFLIHAERTDEALASLQKTFELDPNYWFAYQQAASAYIEKGMFAEAIVTARKGRESYDASSRLISFLGYALAKSGRRAEAQAELEGLLKLSTERYIPPYNIAMIYNGLGDTDKTLAWLEKGYQQRDPRMTFLKVEPKWNNLRDDPRFQDLLLRVGFSQ